jgi:predicted nucleic acid-binding protein
MITCRKKAGLSKAETAVFFAGLRRLRSVESLPSGAHDVGQTFAARYQLLVYDALILTAAMIAKFETLWSNSRHGVLLVDGCLWALNPFVWDEFRVAL